MRKFVCMLAAVVYFLMASSSGAKVYWLPDYLGENLSRSSDTDKAPSSGGGGGIDNSRSCPNGWLNSSQIGDKICVAKGSYPWVGICYGDCVCNSSIYPYTSSNCNRTLSGSTCTDSSSTHYSSCICNTSTYPYTTSNCTGTRGGSNCTDDSGTHYASCTCNSSSYPYTTSNCTGTRGGSTCKAGSTTYYSSCTCNSSTYPYTSSNCSGTLGGSTCKKGSTTYYSTCTTGCPGYYDCGGPWQYCTGSKCSTDNTKCSVYCVNDYFPNSCSSSSYCNGVYRSGYCSGSCNEPKESCDTSTYPYTSSNCSGTLGGTTCSDSYGTHYKSCTTTSSSCTSSTHPYTSSNCTGTKSGSCTTSSGTTRYSSCTCSSSSYPYTSSNCSGTLGGSTCKKGSTTYYSSCTSTSSTCSTSTYPYTSSNCTGTKSGSCTTSSGTKRYSSCTCSSSSYPYTSSNCSGTLGGSTCKKGSTTYYSSCTVTASDPCDSYTNKSCAYGCASYYSDCSSKCQTCNPDPCAGVTGKNCSVCKTYNSSCDACTECCDVSIYKYHSSYAVNNNCILGGSYCKDAKTKVKYYSACCVSGGAHSSCPEGANCSSSACGYIVTSCNSGYQIYAASNGLNTCQCDWQEYNWTSCPDKAEECDSRTCRGSTRYVPTKCKDGYSMGKVGDIIVCA